MEPSETQFLSEMARLYLWDRPEDAPLDADRIVRRVMDLGVWEDAMRLQTIFGRRRLVSILERAPAGAMRARSWWFWHYRLGLTAPTDDPPPMPSRRIA